MRTATASEHTHRLEGGTSSCVGDSRLSHDVPQPMSSATPHDDRGGRLDRRTQHRHAQPLVVAVTLLRHGRRALVRILGALYPSFVLLVIVDTGNHFLLDAAAGAITTAVAAASASVITRKPRHVQLARFFEQSPSARRPGRIGLWGRRSSPTSELA